MTFDVIDQKTGEYPDLEHIARTEEWAQRLNPCDTEGFCITEDGNLILMDECGNYAFCPDGRFQVDYVFAKNTLLFLTSKRIVRNFEEE